MSCGHTLDPRTAAFPAPGTSYALCYCCKRKVWIDAGGWFPKYGPWKKGKGRGPGYGPFLCDDCAPAAGVGWGTS